MALSNKQQAFISHYLIDRNATRAAIRAGYSAKTAYSIGPENLKKPEIVEAIKARTNEIVMSADEVLTRLADMARGDISDLMALTTSGFTFELLIDDGNGNKIPNPKTKLIRKIKQKVTTYLAKSEDGEDREIIETELELYDAQAALVQIGRYHALFTDKTEVAAIVEVKDVRDNILRKLAGSTTTGDADEVSE